MADGGGSCTTKYVFIILTVLVVIAYIIAVLVTRCFGCTSATVSPNCNTSSSTSSSGS